MRAARVSHACEEEAEAVVSGGFSPRKEYPPTTRRRRAATPTTRAELIDVRQDHAKL